MCGRLACTLAPGNIVRACTYKDKDGVEHQPKWVDASDGATYYPSANIPPTSYTPILTQDKPESERQVQPMMWGLVPWWHKGTNPKSHGLSTHNARIEGIEDSRLYKTYLEQRCVIVCDGFYEWQRGGAKKQPYLVYAGQEKDHEIEEVLDYGKDPDAEMNEGDWTGPKLLYMAGLYGMWTDDDGVTVNSYTIITRDSGPVLSWLHNRVPCILSTDTMVSKWLDPDLDTERALDMLKAPKQKDLEWHAVSTEVGNVKNQDLDLIKEVEPAVKEEKKAGKGGGASKASKSLMSNWLIKSPKVEESQKSESSESKAGTSHAADAGIKSEQDEPEGQEPPEKKVKLDHESVKEEEVDTPGEIKQEAKDDVIKNEKSED